jgi:hypothetical protein
VWLRAEASTGSVGFSEVGDWSGPVAQLRTGIEGRRCTASRRACGIIGVDLGVQRFHEMYYDHGAGIPDMTRDQVVVVPRALLDAGGAHVRVRVGVEGAKFVTGTAAGGPDGYVALVAGVAYQW